jgi:hypothetical protein
MTSGDPVEAPFSRIGPGQSMRLVYQVMGQDGPIQNPRGIRYIPAQDEVSTAGGPMASLPPSLSDASALMGLAQMANLNLGVSVANLGVSTAILVEVRKQSRMLRELQAGMDEVRTGVERLVEMTERIDINVAEVQLRETLRHAMRSAIRDVEVDLALLGDLLRPALDRFVQSLGGELPAGARWDLVLSSDVREMVEACANLLYAGRVAALEAHNQACAGSAASVIRDDTVVAHMRRLAETAALLSTAGAGTRAVGREATDARGGKSLFERGSEMRSHVRRLLSNLDRDLGTLLPVAPARALLTELENQPVFAQARDDGAAALAGVAEDYLTSWLAHTDAGLLWRARHELDLQQDAGYWNGVGDWLTPLQSGGDRQLVGAQRTVIVAP